MSGGATPPKNSKPCSYSDNTSAESSLQSEGLLMVEKTNESVSVKAKLSIKVSVAVLAATLMTKGYF